MTYDTPSPDDEPVDFPIKMSEGLTATFGELLSAYQQCLMDEGFKPGTINEALCALYNVFSKGFPWHHYKIISSFPNESSLHLLSESIVPLSFISTMTNKILHKAAGIIMTEVLLTKGVGNSDFENNFYALHETASFPDRQERIIQHQKHLGRIIQLAEDFGVDSKSEPLSTLKRWHQVTKDFVENIGKSEGSETRRERLKESLAEVASFFKCIKSIETLRAQKFQVRHPSQNP